MNNAREAVDTSKGERVIEVELHMNKRKPPESGTDASEKNAIRTRNCLI